MIPAPGIGLTGDQSLFRLGLSTGYILFAQSFPAGVILNRVYLFVVAFPVLSDARLREIHVLTSC